MGEVLGAVREQILENVLTETVAQGKVLGAAREMVKTGDDSALLVWLILIMLSAAGLSGTLGFQMRILMERRKIR